MFSKIAAIILAFAVVFPASDSFASFSDCCCEVEKTSCCQEESSSDCACLYFCLKASPLALFVPVKNFFNLTCSNAGFFLANDLQKIFIAPDVPPPKVLS